MKLSVIGEGAILGAGEVKLVFWPLRWKEKEELMITFK
jgi:hypothetical protein